MCFTIVIISGAKRGLIRFGGTRNPNATNASVRGDGHQRFSVVQIGDRLGVAHLDHPTSATLQTIHTVGASFSSSKGMIMGSKRCCSIFRQISTGDS